MDSIAVELGMLQRYMEGSRVPKRPKPPLNPYTNKVVSKILRMTAKYFQKNRERWTQGSVKRIVNGKGCYCLESAANSAALQLNLPHNRNRHPWFPDTRLRAKLEKYGIGANFNDREARTVDDIIRCCREVAHRLR